MQFLHHPKIDYFFLAKVKPKIKAPLLQSEKSLNGMANTEKDNMALTHLFIWFVIEFVTIVFI